MLIQGSRQWREGLKPSPKRQKRTRGLTGDGRYTSIDFNYCLCPHSITSLLLKICLKPGLRHVLSRSPTCRRQVRDQKKSGTWSPTKKVASRITSVLLKTCLKPSLRHVLSRSPTCRRQVRDQKKSGTWSPTK